MAKQEKLAEPTIKIVKRKTDWRAYFKRYWQLYALLALPLIYLFVFKYVPMTYVQIAFKKFMLNKNKQINVWTMPTPMQKGCMTVHESKMTIVSLGCA